MDYKKVMQFANPIDIGEQKDIPRAEKSVIDKQLYQQSDNEDSAVVPGCYRDLESFLVKLASLYLYSYR